MRWFRRKKKKQQFSIAPVDVVTDDPIEAMVVAMSMNTGKSVVGTVDEDGKPHFRIIENDDDTTPP